MRVALLLSLACGSETEAPGAEPCLDSDPDAPLWYPDGDRDGFGTELTAVRSCRALKDHSTVGGDCDDGDEHVHPQAQERCNEIDDDCDGQIDDADDSLGASEGLVWWVDADQDGQGAGEPSWSCVLPEGAADNDSDCRDSDPLSFLGATELCDGLDNSCDGQIDEGVLGTEQSCPSPSCLDLALSGESESGVWWVDPSGADPFTVYCDLVSDGGGWTLLTWSEDTTIPREEGGYQGEPYPGTQPCPTLDCAYGSAESAERLQAVLAGASEFGSGMSEQRVPVLQDLAAHEYASRFDYQDLSHLTLNTGAGACDPSQFTYGRHYVLTGPGEYDGALVHLPAELRNGDHDHGGDAEIAWTYGTATPACEQVTGMPSVLNGSFGPASWGPYLPAAEGARSTWVR